jgi:hypothetical protein
VKKDPRRHHHVPHLYLDRFADSNQRVWVRRRDGKSFPSNTENVTVETGFYDTRGADGERSTEVEEILNRFESPAAEALRFIDAHGVAPDLESPHRIALAHFMGLQLARTPEMRERVLFSDSVDRYAAGREITQELVADYLTTEHLGFAPSPPEVAGAHTFLTAAPRGDNPLGVEFSIEMMWRSAETTSPHLAVKHWTIEHDRKARFITSDTPLVLWAKPSEMDDITGIGIGTADEIRLPLDPGKQLVLTPRARAPQSRVNSARVVACNRDVADACHRLVIGHPAHEAAMRALPMRDRRPVMRFSQGPGYSVGPDGRNQYMGEILHSWVPRR